MGMDHLAGPGLGRASTGPPALSCSRHWALTEAGLAGSDAYGEDFRPTSSQGKKHLMTDPLAHIVSDSLLCLHQKLVSWRSWEE